MRTTVLGTELAMPIILAPVGSSRMFYPRGEEVAARVAGSFGTIYTLSTLSGCLLEDVKKPTTGPAWYQLYLIGGHDVARTTIERARKSGYSALVVTIDTPVAGMRERDLRNGMKELVTLNPWKMLPFVMQFAVKPRWLAGFFSDGGMMKFPNVVLPGEGPMLYADVGTALESSVVTWADLKWIREAWQGPIVVKGVHIGDDARRAIDAGANAIVVSNHGGRQLDDVHATIRALPEVVAAARGQVEVLVDGGIRRGSDVAKALCLGARGCSSEPRVRVWFRGGRRGAGSGAPSRILRADSLRRIKCWMSVNLALDRSYAKGAGGVGTGERFFFLGLSLRLRVLGF